MERHYTSFTKNEINTEEFLFPQSRNSNNFEDFNVRSNEMQKKEHMKSIIQLFSEGLYEKALISCKLNYELSKDIFRTKFNPSSKNYNVLLNYLSDGLLYVKALVKSDQINNARVYLIKFLKNFLKYFNENEVFTNEQMNDLSMLHKKLILRKFTNFLSTFAALFAAIGDFNNAETLYIKYVKLIENNIGRSSLDSSNCYFLIGLFYHQHVCIIILKRFI